MANTGSPLGGRPSDIDAVLAFNDRDEPITVADRIVSQMEIGAYVEQAAAAAGISKMALYNWRKTAAKLRIRAGGRLTDAFLATLSEHEVLCIDLDNRITEAEARFELGSLSVIQRLAVGGIRTTVTTTKTERRERPNPSDPDHPLIEWIETERTVREEVLAPSLAALQWRMSRRFPDRYGGRIMISEDPGNLSDEEHEAALGDAMTAYLQGRAEERAESKAQRRRSK